MFEQLWTDEEEDFDPGATLWRGTLLFPQTISSSEEECNVDHENSKIFKVRKILNMCIYNHCKC